jgi:long-chain acyl-CoA synthetase
VPLVLDTLHQRILSAIHKFPPPRRALASLLLSASNTYIRAKRLLSGMDVLFALRRPSVFQRLAAAALSLLLLPLYKLAQAAVFKKIREQLGITRAVISGGGSLAAHLDDFYEAAELPVLNGW